MYIYCMYTYIAGYMKRNYDMSQAPTAVSTCRPNPISAHGRPSAPEEVTLTPSLPRLDKTGSWAPARGSGLPAGCSDCH